MNHWIKMAKNKQLFREIDEIGLEVFSEDGTLGDFLSSLNDEQTAYLMNMPIGDLMADPDELSFVIELV